MPRRRRAEIREVAADAVYNSTLVEKFVNSLMWQGKKNTAQGIFYDAMEKIRERTSDDPLKAFKKAVENAKPMLEVKTRRVGGANYRVPIEVPRTGGLRWPCAGSSPTPARVPKRAWRKSWLMTVSYTHLRAHETRHDLVCRLL